jgi:hypothetical protein
VEGGTIIHIQSIPGSYPKQIVAIGIKLVDGTVGKAIAVIIMLDIKRRRLLCICIRAKEKQRRKRIKKLQDSSHFTNIDQHQTRILAKAMLQ